MHNSLTLIKYELLGLYNKFNKNKNSLILVLFISSIIISLLIFQSVLLSLTTISELASIGYEYLVFNSPILMWISFSIMFIVSNSVITKEKDTDILLSLPIKKSSIIFSKSFLNILFYFLVGSLLIIPTTFVYIFEYSNDYSILISSFLLLIFLSIIFCSISYFYNTIINTFIIKLRYYKIVRAILVLSSIFFLLFSLLYKSNNTNFLYINKLVSFIINKDLDTLVILTLFTITLFTSSIFIYSKMYGKQTKSFINKNKEIKISNNNILLSLIKKEFVNYINSTMYLFNTIVGYILLLGGAIYLSFSNHQNIEMIIYLYLTFTISITCTTNSSISLEGKNIWILKTAPVKVHTILLSKVLMNILLIFVTVTSSFLILLISNKIDITTLILLYLLSLIISIFISFSGIIINLLLPKLDFKNEMEVVKQSSSAIISILFFILFLSTPSLSYLLEIISLNLNTLILINIVYLIILNIFILFIFYKVTPKLFKKL